MIAKVVVSVYSVAIRNYILFGVDMPQKYEIISDDFVVVEKSKLFRIRATQDFGSVKRGDLGGYIERELNLAHLGNCWVFGSSCVYEGARIRASGSVHDSAHVYGMAKVGGKARISGNAHVFGQSEICDNAIVSENASVFDKAVISGNAKIVGHAKIYGRAEVTENASVAGRAKAFGDVSVVLSARVTGRVSVDSGEVYVDTPRPRMKIRRRASVKNI